MDTYHIKNIEVEGGIKNQRLDHYLYGLCPNYPKSFIQKMIRSKRLRVNDLKVGPGYRISSGDTICMPYYEEYWGRKPIKKNKVGRRHKASWFKKIIYTDDDCMVVDKPSGIPVHSGSGQTRNLIEELSSVFTDQTLKLCHRLDRYTSGCICLAKNWSFLTHFQKQLINNQIEKIYLAKLEGVPTFTQKKVETPLKTIIGPGGFKMSQPDMKGKKAITHFRVLFTDEESAVVEVRTVHGRLHQIRAHAKLLGYPVWGDQKYGGMHKANNKGDKFLLHCQSIRFSNQYGDTIRAVAGQQKWHLCYNEAHE